MDQLSLVYKVDILYLGTLLSSLILTLIQGFFTWSTLRSCNYNTMLFLTLLSKIISIVSWFTIESSKMLLSLLQWTVNTSESFWLTEIKEKQSEKVSTR